MQDTTTTQSHAATLIKPTAHRGALYKCDCGRLFNAVKHPVEDTYDSTGWERHVREEQGR